MTRRQIIKHYKDHFSLQDIPFRMLGDGDKAIIEWAEQLVKNCDLADVVGQSEQLKAFCQYCESRQIKPKRFNWDEIIKDFESL